MKKSMVLFTLHLVKRTKKLTTAINLKCIGIWSRSNGQSGGGEIWFDGELIRKDGIFVTDDLKKLNPEYLLAE